MDSAGWPKEYESSLGVPKCELFETPNAGPLGYPSMEESETLTSLEHTRGSLDTLLKSYFFPNVGKVDEPIDMFCLTRCSIRCCSKV